MTLIFSWVYTRFSPKDKQKTNFFGLQRFPIVSLRRGEIKDIQLVATWFIPFMYFLRHQIFGPLSEISKIRTHIYTSAIFFPNVERFLVWHFSLSFVLWKMSQFRYPSLVKCDLESKSSADIDHSPKHSFLACMCAKSLQSCLILWNPMHYSLPAPLSMGFSREEYWSGLPFPSPADLPKPGMESALLYHRRSPAWQANNWATREACKGSTVNKLFMWWCLFALDPQEKKVHWAMNDGYGLP